jgi:hypothetical protein
MYVNLLAREMSSEMQPLNHPGFVEIIRQLTAEEARVGVFVQKYEAIPVTADWGGAWKISERSFAELTGDLEGPNMRPC